MMQVKIRTADVHFSLPVPVSLAGAVVRLLPQQLFTEAQAAVPAPYGALLTKETVGMVAAECLEVLRENRGLEIVRVEARDGTFVSIRL